MNDGISENPAFWSGALDRYDATLGAAIADVGESDPVDFWFSCMVPTYNQSGPSCVGHAWANWIEGMVRRWIDPLGIPQGKQIDGEAIWRRGREMFWKGNLSGGLYLDQGFHAAKSLGWIPECATVKPVAQDWDSINAALHMTPLVQGHKINKGWLNASTVSGCIDHDAPKDSTGAHATLLVATLRQPDTSGNVIHWRVLLNSWGAGRGRFGFFTLTEAEWFEQTMTDSPWTADIPDVFNWFSWEKGLVSK